MRNKGTDMGQKWRVTRSETLLQDRWINLRADHCVTPSGVEISPYYVLSYPDWVHVVAITNTGSLVLVRQYRHAAGEFSLELPGGIVEPQDASLEHTARREFEEETGFTAQRWQYVAGLRPNPATHTNRVHFFLALDAAYNRPPSLDAGEHGLHVEVLDVASVLDGVRSGLLAHATHVSGLLLGLGAAGRLSLAAT
jgi:8-oxo-dGTP pyrophosphatase MutT (NUDIX family)